MPNPFVKQIGQSAGDFAKKIAKQVIQEPLEVLKSDNKPPSGEKPAAISESSPIPMAPEVTISKIEEQKIHQEASSRLSQLESEIQRLINERKQRDEEWKKQMDQNLGINQNKPQEREPLIQPTSKKKRGFMGNKGKQGTKEMSKSPSG